MFLWGLLFSSGVIFMLCYGQWVLGTRLGPVASAGISLPIGLFTTGLLLTPATLAVATPVPLPTPWVPPRR